MSLSKGALPYFIEREQRQPVTAASVEYCSQAFTQSAKTGTVGALAWNGNVNSMKK
jgi:hypothetical protein